MQRLFINSLVIFCSFALTASAGVDSVVPLTDGVGVEEKFGERVSRDLVFNDQNGREVQLNDLLAEGKPIILAPVYYSCPGMCTLVLNGVLRLINDIKLDLGEDYLVVNVSFDVNDTPELAKAKAKNYYAMLDDKEKANNWYFLSGSPENVDTLMDQIGFRYKPIGDQFSHASVLVVLEQNGIINRYVYEANYNAKDVRRALVEASQGKIGNPFDQILVYCFRYDPIAGKHVPIARNIMKAGGALTLFVMALAGFILWKKELPQLRRQ